MIPNQIENGLAVAVVSWLIALLVAILSNGIKAYRMVSPLVVTISDEIRSPNFFFNDDIKGYSATAIVTNRSSAHLKDCVAYVMNAPNVDGSIQPRYVEQFDLPPESKKYVHFGYWFSRQPPNSDDPDINLSGPTGAAFGGNRCKVPSPSRLHFRVLAQDIDCNDVHCDLWIDRDARRLCAAQIQESGSEVAKAPNLEATT